MENKYDSNNYSSNHCECPICLSPICLSPISGNGKVTTTCGHSFCLKCFLKHCDTKNECPLCRGQIRLPEEILRPNFPEWTRLVDNIHTMINALSYNNSLSTVRSRRTIELLTQSTSITQFEASAQYYHAEYLMEERRRIAAQRDHEAAAVEQERVMQERNVAREARRVARQDAEARKRARLAEDHEKGIIVGAKICVNRRFGLPHPERALATITKVMIVNIEAKLDDSDMVVKLRKTSPCYSLIPRD